MQQNLPMTDSLMEDPDRWFDRRFEEKMAQREAALRLVNRKPAILTGRRPMRPQPGLPENVC